MPQLAQPKVADRTLIAVLTIWVRRTSFSWNHASSSLFDYVFVSLFLSFWKEIYNGYIYKSINSLLECMLMCRFYSIA